MGAGASKRASAAQVKSKQSAIQTTDQAKNDALNREQQVYNTAKTGYQPYQDAGTASLKQLMAGIAPGGEFTQTLNADNFKALDPGYDFRLQQGQQALERAQNATGGMSSGASLKALTRYGQDYASGEFGNAYNRFTNNQNLRFGRLSSLAGMGEAATNAVTSAGENYANAGANIDMGAAKQIGQYLTGIGDAQASGIMGRANSLGGMIANLGNTAAGLPWGKMLGAPDGGYTPPKTATPTAAQWADYDAGSTKAGYRDAYGNPAFNASSYDWDGGFRNG
jgi:hypothetical protein